MNKNNSNFSKLVQIAAEITRISYNTPDDILGGYLKELAYEIRQVANNISKAEKEG